MDPPEFVPQTPLDFVVDDYIKLSKGCSGEETKARTVRMFNFIDTDQDGLVDRDEVTAFLGQVITVSIHL